MMIEMAGSQGVSGTANESTRCIDGCREINTNNEIKIATMVNNRIHAHQTAADNFD